jgi:alpha-L-fucosidase
VKCSALAGWTSPADEEATVINGQKASLTRTYIQQLGSLQVTLAPAAARVAGAQWRVDGGLWHDSDVARLKEFRAAIDAAFKTDPARGKPATASNTRGSSPAFAPSNAVDGDKKTYWATDDNVVNASLEVDLGAPTKINRAVIQEYIPLGQRVKDFRFEAHDGVSWMEIARGQTIGYKRILRFADVTVSKVRLKVLDARGPATISNLAVYCAPQ